MGLDRAPTAPLRAPSDIVQAEEQTILGLNRGMAYGMSLGYFALMAGPAVALTALAIYYHVVRPSETPTGALVLAIFFSAGALVFLPRVLSERKGASLRVDRKGIHLVRGSRRSDDLSWDTIAVVRRGLRRIRFGKVSSVGYSIFVEGAAGNRSIEVDDVSFKVPREAIANVAGRIATMAEERNIRVESPATVEW